MKFAVLIRLLVIMLFVPQIACAIDNGFFGGLKPETAKQVLISFQAPVHYVVSETRGTIYLPMDKKGPDMTRTYERATLLFIERADAVAYQQKAQKQFTERLKVLKTDMNAMLLHLYEVRNEPPSNSEDKPDTIIIETLQPMVNVIEAFVDENQKPYVHEVRGKKFIPAFLTRQAALDFEATHNMAEKGKFMRRGLDFRSHLRFVERYVNTSTPVVTFGNEMPYCMDIYVRYRR